LTLRINHILLGSLGFGLYYNAMDNQKPLQMPQPSVTVDDIRRTCENPFFLALKPIPLETKMENLRYDLLARIDSDPPIGRNGRFVRSRSR
jgi:hypothetical protein